ncbi:MAG: DNA-binding protein [Bacteroidota bacterium]
MEVVILSKEQFEELQVNIKEIKTHVKQITSPAEHFVDNKAFVKMMGISVRTAQVWRDEGKIGFTQEGEEDLLSDVGY